VRNVGCIKNTEIIHLVLDDFNTHKIGLLYITFHLEEAFRIASKLEIHYTPTHGSWLNMDECELATSTAQCIETRRLLDLEMVCSEISAWGSVRNSNQKDINWQFKTSDARIKLKRLFPVIKE